MIEIHSIADMQAQSSAWKREAKTVAVVPTMGALHDGHISLAALAREKADRVIVTIFVNPTQFGEGEDLDAYPRPLDADLKRCEDAGVDVVFLPEVHEMYNPDSSTWVEEMMLGNGLCGGARPGHFRGVTTIVAKLFLATLPDFAVFGEKDFQQLAVIRRMVRDLNFPVEVVPGPIVRETDGLAMSSRNRYLSEKNRIAALAISSSLRWALDAIKVNSHLDVKETLAQIELTITKSGGEIDYVEAVNAQTLEPLDDFSSQQEIRLLAAAFFGKARLIDNMGPE